MRVVTLLALTLVVTLAMLVRYNKAVRMHHLGILEDVRRLPISEDDEDFRPRHYMNPDEEAFIRRSGRASDDAFDDYGHLRFGRSGAED